MLNRRNFLLGFASSAAARQPSSPRSEIDRRALVARHHPVVTAFDPLAPLSVGNGEFAFTADPTGLQSFPALYEKSMPLCTQSQWGWHSHPLPPGLSPDALRLAPYDTFGRSVGYPTSSTGQKELFDWLRENPHRLRLVPTADSFAFVCRFTARDEAAAPPAARRKRRGTPARAGPK
jgi:hypothetical protein